MTKKIRLFLAHVAPPSRFVQRTPPLGLLYLAAYLRERYTVDIAVVHQGIEHCSSEQLARKAIDFDADIVGLRCLTPSAHALPIITRAIRLARPRALIVLGGPHVAAFGGESLGSTDADLAVCGEGEITMTQIVAAYLGQGEYEHISGLIRRTSEGEIVTNAGVPPIVHDLDSLPFPAYDLIDTRKYWNEVSMPPIPRRKYISLFSSRGCPYGCSYCHNVFGRKFRAHSPGRIVEEIKYYTKRYGADEIEFIDDCFNLSKDRVLEYVNLLLKSNGPVKTAFPNALRADLLDEETVDALVKSGMYYTSLALESGSPRIQELIGKRLDIPRYLQAVDLCVKNRVFTNGFVMLGFPTETEEEIRQTIETASCSRLHIASFFTVTPFPNTNLYRYVEAHMPDKLGVQRYTEMEYWSAKINLTEIADATFFAYQRKAIRRFYSRPGRLFRIIRDYPKPLLLPTYLPMLVQRMGKGLF